MDGVCNTHEADKCIRNFMLGNLYVCDFQLPKASALLGEVSYYTD
jgi:hypothetical protein